MTLWPFEHDPAAAEHDAADAEFAARTREADRLAAHAPQPLTVVIEPAPAGREDCPDCYGVGWTIDDPGGPIKDMPPMLPARTCQRCQPGKSYGVAAIRVEARTDA